MNDDELLNFLRAGSIAIFFFIALICSLAPVLYFRKKQLATAPGETQSLLMMRNLNAADPIEMAQKAEGILSFINCFAAGLFVALSIIHIVPEAEDTMKQVYGEETANNFRPSSLVLITAYTVLLAIQRVAFTHEDPHGNPFSHQAHADQENTAKVNASVSCDGAPHRARSSLIGHGHDIIARRLSQMSDSSRRRGVSVTSSAHATGGLLTPNSKGHQFSVPVASTSPSLGVSPPLPSLPPPPPPTQPQPAQVAETIPLPATPTSPLIQPPATSTLRAYVLLLALSLHSVAESMTLGLQTTLTSMLTFFFAILIHKGAASLALGVSFFKAEVDIKSSIGFLIFYSFVAPIGIALGWIFAALFPTSVNAYCMAFSGGTFLYIGCSEVVVEEFVLSKAYWKKMFSFIFGILMIYGITVWTESQGD